MSCISIAVEMERVWQPTLKRNYSHQKLIPKKFHLQISKFSSSAVDKIVIYRSQSANFSELNKEIETITDRKKPQLIIGDFNFCYLTSTSNATRKYLLSKHFFKLIQEPTHIEGNLLDQAYLRDIGGILDCTAEVHSKYYTDYKGIAIVINTVEKNNFKVLIINLFF